MSLLQDLVSAYGPPGEEGAVREVLRQNAPDGYLFATDAKGNLRMQREWIRPRIVVTAHLDEIAMIVRDISPAGHLVVGALGGLYPWKLGEGPVAILADSEPINGVLSFGSIHTDDPRAVATQAKKGPLGWEMATVFTGLSREELLYRGVRPGTRVVVHHSRRQLFEMGDFVGGHFLDDRADVAAMVTLMAQVSQPDVMFIGTVSEEVGGHGALYALGELRPDICIALELGALVPDAPAVLSSVPTVWVSDSYAATSPDDLRLLAALEPRLQFQAFGRGGSDASCAASHGLCARPVTLGIPMANSHGYEIMHRDAVGSLAAIAAKYIAAVS